MEMKELVKSVKNNAKNEVYDQKEILLLCEKIKELIAKPKLQQNKFSNLSAKDWKESQEASERASKED